MVSIIVPVYNVEKYLDECLRSIVNQTLKDIEILLIDDGSTDSSGKICDRFAKLDNRVHVIHKDNGGSTAARNTGLALAKGEFVGFVDSDDWIEPDMYEILERTIIRDSSDMVMALKYINKEGYEYIVGHPVKEGVYDENNNDELIDNLIYCFDNSKKPVSPSLYEKLFRKDFLLQHQMNVSEDIRIGEDGITVYSCVLKAKRVSVINDVVYHYRIRMGSLCNSEDKEYFKIINNRYLELRKRCKGHKNEKSLVAQMDRDMLKFVIWGVNSMFGFGYGTIIPRYIPPYDYLEKNNVKEFVLYGAGVIGQAYYKAFSINRNYKVNAWVDKKYERYVEQNLPVESTDILKNLRDEYILIAVEEQDLAERIKKELCQKGIKEENILYSCPIEFTNTF